MRRVLNLSLVVTASVLFIWLLPFTSTSVSGVEEVTGGIEQRSLLGRILSWVATILTWWERWNKERFYQRVDRFISEHCDPIWGVLFKTGFFRLGSANPQTVLGHRLAVEARFVREARIEGFSDDDVAKGVYLTRLHETDEAATRREQERLALPHRKAARESFVEEWWPDDEWVPVTSVLVGVTITKKADLLLTSFLSRRLEGDLLRKRLLFMILSTLVWIRFLSWFGTVITPKQLRKESAKECRSIISIWKP